MSTKALVIIGNDDASIYLTRERDGFVAATGGDLACALWRVGTKPKLSAVTSALLALKSESGEPIFALADGVPDDIKFAYNVDLSDGGVRVVIACAPPHNPPAPDVWMESNQLEYDGLRPFVEAVNGDITSMNRRMHETGIGAMFPLLTMLEPASPARRPPPVASRVETRPNSAIEQTAVDLIRMKLNATKTGAVVEGRGTGGKKATIKEAMEAMANRRTEVERKPAPKPVPKGKAAALAPKGKPVKRGRR